MWEPSLPHSDRTARHLQEMEENYIQHFCICTITHFLCLSRILSWLSQERTSSWVIFGTLRPLGSSHHPLAKPGKPILFNDPKILEIGKKYNTERPHPLESCRVTRHLIWRLNWYGNYYQYEYDLSNFMVINTISFDHAVSSWICSLSLSSLSFLSLSVVCLSYSPRPPGPINIHGAHLSLS